MENGRKKFQRSTSWEELGSIEYANGIVASQYTLGDTDDETAPIIVRGTFPPGCVVAPHSHACDYTEIILAGSERVGRRWHRAGDIRIVKGGTFYGPLVAGPEGLTKLVIFRDGSRKTIGLEEMAAVPVTATNDG
jgi:hypothetical protein